VYIVQEQCNKIFKEENVMRKTLVSSFIILLALTFTAEAQRANRGDRGPQMKERIAQNHMPGERGHRFMPALDLSDEQKDQIKEIMLEGKKEAIPFQNQLGEKKARMKTLSSGDTYDVEALNGLADEMAELHASLKKIQIEKRGEIRALLTEDQKVIFDSMPDRKEKGKRKIGRRNR